MNGLEIRSFDSPDETRPYVVKGHAALVALGPGTVLKYVCEPGWRWSQHAKPIAGTASCQNRHLGYVLSGRMRIVMDDGSNAEVRPGDVFSIAPGHEAWTVGDEACVTLDFGQIEHSPEAHR